MFQLILLVVVLSVLLARCLCPTWHGVRSMPRPHGRTPGCGGAAGPYAAQIAPRHA